MTAAVTDFTQYTTLRAEARADDRDPRLLREVAGQFEALFVETLLENMRAASLGEDLLGQGSQHDLYEQMLDQQLAVEMTREQGLGLADLLVRQLQQAGAATADQAPEAGGAGFSIAPRPTRSVRETQPMAAGPIDAGLEANRRATPAAIPEDAADVPAADPGIWQSPQAFVADIWSHAKQAAERFGTDVRALVAQAALETGWGSHVIRHADGRNSFNLFGVKAGADWTGGSVVRQTIEFRDGIAQREAARFRSYDSLGEAFEDYVRFLAGRSRYRTALGSGSAEGFAHGLQDAGYATDPEYGAKIVRVMQSDTMRDAEQSLKNERSAPIHDGYPARRSAEQRPGAGAEPSYAR